MAGGPRRLVTAIRVALGPRGYDVLVGRGLLARAGVLVRRRLAPPLAAVVVPARVRRLYGAVLARSLRRARQPAVWLSVPDGERAKTMAVLERLLRGLARAGAGRDAAVLAFGGGTTGDVGGLAAALYARGVRAVQIPTTLEAQVDAAIGGKTAVNLPEGKNLAGVFHQPSLVIADPALLRTLPSRQVRAGLAEVVKYGVIASPHLFAWLEREADALRRGDAGALGAAVRASAAIKARIVSRDERERDLRMVLNSGHTAGHALEAAVGYGRLLHGEAVAIGMVTAARLSVRLGVCGPSAARRIEALLRRLGLPVAPPSGLRRARVRAALSLDKKRRAGALRLVLTRDVGDVTVRAGIRPELILEVLDQQGDP